jgi:hypothetical protein
VFVYQVLPSFEKSFYLEKLLEKTGHPEELTQDKQAGTFSPPSEKEYFTTFLSGKTPSRIQLL